MNRDEKEGVWFNGRMNALEHHKFKTLLEMAIMSIKLGRPFRYEDDVIVFIGEPGDPPRTFHDWKFPPREYWSKETKTPNQECVKCWPKGVGKGADREVWCAHVHYNELKCPYGTPTPDRCCPL